MESACFVCLSQTFLPIVRAVQSSSEWTQSLWCIHKADVARVLQRYLNTADAVQRQVSLRHTLNV